MPPGCKRSMMFPQLSGIFFSEHGNTSAHKFAIFCNSFQFSSNYLEKQLFLCCMSVGLCQSAAKGKGKGGENSNRLMKVTKIGFLGVRIFFVLFLFFMFFLFLGFSCLCWMLCLSYIRYIVSAKTNMNTEENNKTNKCKCLSKECSIALKKIERLYISKGVSLNICKLVLLDMCILNRHQLMQYVLKAKGK